jgi:hypothetical protein
MGGRDNEELDEVATKKRSGVSDNETVDLVVGITVDETLAGGDRALKNFVRSLRAQPRDLTLDGECFETVKGSGEADDAAILARKGPVSPLLTVIGACRGGWLLLRTYVRFFSSSTLALS